SYFERLYRRCVEQGWHWAYGQLDRQGRMHKEIMAFPNLHFYGGKLRALSEDTEHAQCLSLAYAVPHFDSDLEKILSEKRVVFIPAASEAMLPHQKTSLIEAEMTTRIVLF